MHINIESTETGDKPAPSKPPPDFMSRGAKLKLLTLVGSLMLVLVLMNEARKPDNWKWMGFDEQGKQLEASEKSKKFVIEEAQYDSPPKSAPDSDSEAQKKLPPSDSQVDTQAKDEQDSDQPVNQQTETQSDFGNSSPATNVSLSQPEFYQVLYNQLGLEEQRALFAVMRRLRSRGFSNEREYDFQRLATRMDEFARVHLSEMLNDLSLIEEGNPRREELNGQLETMQIQWDQQLKPALAGEPISSRQQQRTIHALQAELDKAAYAVVQDKSAPTWASDDPAWLRTWERILNVSNRWKTDQLTTPIQLKAEPDFYRGKPVAMQGELRGIEVLKTRNNPMGIQQYYSLWIRPQESAIQPYNVYVVELPESIELSGNRFTEFKKVKVDLLGAFFKVRTYDDVGGEVSATPLVFAKSFAVSESEPEVEEVPVAPAWEPSKGTLTTFFIGMPLIAFVMAYLIYRGTTSRRIQTGSTVASQINESLVELEKDARVKTVQEKLASMEGEGLT
jgi:hypothetical protein